MKTPTVREIRQEREEILYQFHQEAIRLHLTVEEALGNFRYTIYDNQTGRNYTATVLPCSFDFYVHRLNITKTNINLLIVHKHNAVVPLHVASLSQVHVYEPLEVPQLQRKDSKRRNHEESMLLLSKLILNFESAQDELSKLTERTRRRYEQMRKEYLKPRRGKPWT